MLPVCIAVFGASVFISLCLTYCIRNLAVRYRWTTCSNASHHIHERQVPRLGGLAVSLTFFLGLGIYIALSHWFGSGLAPVSSDILKLLVPALLLLATGLSDDLVSLTARSKLLGQILGGVALYAGGLHPFEALLQRFYPWLAAGMSCVLAVFFVVLMCNAMNLIDGLDGLAAGVSLFSMASILTLALVGGQPPLAVPTLVMAGGVAGFLIFNFYPASIFLGDSGSMFLGLMLSGLVISLSNRQGSTMNSLMLPVFCFALPLTDTSISVLRRLLRRRSPFQADRRHIHHMLLKLGVSHCRAVWILYGAAAIGMLLSLVLISQSPLILGCGAAVLLLLILLCVRKLQYPEFAKIRWISPRIVAQCLIVKDTVGILDSNRGFLTYKDPDLYANRRVYQLDSGANEFPIATTSVFPAEQTEDISG